MPTVNPQVIQQQAPKSTKSQVLGTLASLAQTGFSAATGNIPGAVASGAKALGAGGGSSAQQQGPTTVATSGGGSSTKTTTPATDPAATSSSGYGHPVLDAPFGSLTMGALLANPSLAAYVPRSMLQALIGDTSTNGSGGMMSGSPGESGGSGSSMT